MNELREKLKFHYEMELQNYNPSRISEQDMFADMMLRFIQSQPINKDLECERWENLYLKLKKDYSAVCSAIKEMGNKSKERQDKIKELEKENERLKTLNKINSISKPSDWEKDALHRQLEAKENQITQLQKEIEELKNKTK